MTLILDSPVYFTLVDYQISHSQLLIRGPEAIEGDNIDVVFEGTEFLNCPTNFNGIKIYLLDEDESKERGISILPFTKNFLVESEREQHFIQAGVLRLYRNALTAWETSIDMTGRGQENLLWIRA